jgi:phage shock protein C
MAEKIKSSASAHDLEQTFDVSMNDLESTLQNYMDEDVESVKKKENLLNPITLAGLAILSVSALTVVQIFFPFNARMDEILGFIIGVGGFFMLLTGLGVFTRPKRKKKRSNKTQAVIDETGRVTESYGLERKKKLFKSRTNRRIAGVCGGIADYFGMDAAMVRILFVIFTFIGSGSPILAYIALSFILPKAPKPMEP